MKTYCVKCKKYTESLNSKIFKTKNGRLIMQSKCAGCGFKKSRFVKELEAKGLLSSLGRKTRLSEIPLFGDIFFRVYKMDEIVNKFLLSVDEFMPEMHLKQPAFTYSVCGPFTRNSLCRQEIQILFTEMNLIRLVFNMIWVMVNQKI